MSNPTDNEDGQTSKKPADTAFKQQRLPAWQPIITAKTALPVFFLISITFIPIGIGLVFTSNRVNEFNLDYTDMNCVDRQRSNVTCAQYLQERNHSNETCTCTIDFYLDRLYQGDVYFYYGLTNYYQNHRRYVRSRDDNQLNGATGRVAGECQPFQRMNNGTDLDFTPCGAIANSRFNDTLELFLWQDNITVPLLRTGIAWTTDKAVKFRNPPDPSTFFAGHPRPPNWQQDAWQLDSNDPQNNGYENEDFIVWMRTAAMPTFRKLYRILNRTSSPFQDGLPQGNYTVTIEYNYPVQSFSGRKQFVISTTSWMGGKNGFLGWAYIAIGIACFLTFLIFAILHKKWKK